MFTSPAGEIQIAAVSGIELTRRCPFSGPTRNRVVERASEAVAVFATALTATVVLTGAPVSGSMMCPAELIPIRLAGVCSEVETLLSESQTCGSIFPDGSLRCTSHDDWPGGDPMANIVLPPASMSAREMPWDRKIVTARSTA